MIYACILNRETSESMPGSVFYPSVLKPKTLSGCCRWGRRCFPSPLAVTSPGSNPLGIGASESLTWASRHWPYSSVGQARCHQVSDHPREAWDWSPVVFLFSPPWRPGGGRLTEACQSMKGFDLWDAMPLTIANQAFGPWGLKSFCPSLILKISQVSSVRS